MKRQIVEYFTRALTTSKRRQQIELSAGEVAKVNIGCGLAVAPAWINVDGSLNAWLASRPKWTRSLGYKLSGASAYYSADTYESTLSGNRFVFHDINNGLPFRDSTIDFVFSSHFVEHLSRTQAATLLKECHRVLRPGGVVRISVPDLEYAWDLYRRGEAERMLHDYFFTDSNTSFSHHRYAYNFELMKKALSEAGFDRIERCEYRRGRTPDLEVLDNRGEYSLFVEASKAE